MKYTKSIENLLKEANNDFFAFQKELSQRMRKDYQAMKEASSNISDKEYNKQEWVELNKLKQARNEFDAVQKEITLRLKKASAMPLLQKEKDLKLQITVAEKQAQNLSDATEEEKAAPTEPGTEEQSGEVKA